jgi:hypothetical protein
MFKFSSASFEKRKIVTVLTVCHNSAIANNAPTMVQRILTILAESRSIWPLASRWSDHLQRFFVSQDVTPVGPEGSMDESVSVSRTTAAPSLPSNTSQRDPIPHFLDPTLSHPLVKPIQPQFLGPFGDEQSMLTSQEPNMSISNLPQPPTGPAGYSDTSNNLPLSVSQSPASPGPDRQA